MHETGEKCPHCDAGLKPIKTKRQYVHYLLPERKIIICKRVS